MGIMLGMGVLTESGVLGDIAKWLFTTFNHNVWIIGFLLGIVSSVVDTFTVAITNISFFPVGNGVFDTNGIYWLIISFCTAMGGCLLSIGSSSGIALMHMEHMHMGWYLRNVSWKILIGFVLGLVVLYLETLFL
jgi:Na+/H+ antiporter NhaD/arsenite permease-like protein